MLRNFVRILNYMLVRIVIIKTRVVKDYHLSNKNRNIYNIS